MIHPLLLFLRSYEITSWLELEADGILLNTTWTNMIHVDVTTHPLLPLPEEELQQVPEERVEVLSGGDRLLLPLLHPQTASIPS